MKLVKRAEFGWPATTADSAPCNLGLVVHYDGTNQGLAKSNHSKCVEYWKWCRDFHIHSRGWRDIGYSFGCCPHGYIFEGRGWQKEQAAQPGGNRDWTSVTFMSGPSEAPTPAQIDAFRQLRNWLRGKGMRDGMSYHSHFFDTSCPGDILRKMVIDGTLVGKDPVPAHPKWPGIYLRQPPVMRNSAVKTWQAQMLKRGWDIKVDGVYGPASDETCRRFQRDKGLKVDGIVGKKTWDASFEEPIT